MSPEQLMEIMETTGLAAIGDPWLRSLAIFAGALVYLTFLALICLISLPKERPLRPIATWKGLLFLLFFLPVFSVGLLVPYLLAFLNIERALGDGWLYQGWIAFLFLGSFLPGFILVWRRFHGYETTPNNTPHPDARNAAVQTQTSDGARADGRER